MQYQKLTSDQHQWRSWRKRRDHRVSELLAMNPNMLRRDAIAKVAEELPPPSKSGLSAHAIDGYSLRTKNLKRLGFASYVDYLESELWKEIRKKFLAKHEFCYVCDIEPATQVHHAKYEFGTLAGVSEKHLRPICGECHRLSEFDENGKRSPMQATQRQTWMRVILGHLRKSKGDPTLPVAALLCKVVINGKDVWIIPKKKFKNPKPRKA